VRLLVALSGGSDSVALTLLMRELAGPLGFAIATLAHVNHQLRPEADRDERFCRDLASRLGLPIVVSAIDVAGYAAAEGLSIEDAARRARYAFLHRAAADAAADRIAVGHTRDDQAETVLLKLIRGAGLTGLAGISPRRGLIVRPLLDVSRSDLRHYLARAGETWVEDESNALLGTPRNRIRHRVLPELEQAYAGATRAVARTAGSIREDALWLDALAGTRFDELANQTADGWWFDAARLGAEPAPVCRRVLIRAMREASGGREVGLEHVERALDVLAGTAAGVDAPGSRLELRRGKLVLLRMGHGKPPK
jgi:tRNA(Ile)-lysidine synthase